MIMIGICTSFRLILNKNTFKSSNGRSFKRLSHSRLKMSSSTTNNILKEAQTASLEKHFPFITSEKKLYEFWEMEGYFNPDTVTKLKRDDNINTKNEDESYVLPMPPPNVTGYLHMGHAMFIALQDILARFHRMRGKSTLWLPGTDHAGIATQLLVERDLISKGTTRQEVGRDAFLEKVWQWKDDKGGYIIDQMKCLGASADWSREKFTLNDDMSDAVVEAFVRLHEKDLIYKGDYMVNWSPNLQTAVSDLEVDYVEEEGKLYYFKYEVVTEDGEKNFIPVATTRPETILGDTAVCVHPEDERYRDYIGKFANVPILNRKIPIIADEYVDREFGTGALKITPAHDTNDYELGKKHNLEMINIMNKDASINSQGAKYKGMDRFECREKLWQDLIDMDLTIKVDAHTQRVPRSQRGGEVIEPMISAQWFVKMDNMANRAVKAVKDGDVKIIPDRFEKTWYNWLENIHDWCISRQLWWGHRIPVWYPTVDGVEKEYIVARNEEDAKRKAIELFGSSASINLKQDDDVLDTWFSSGLWPFATVGWPDTESSDYKKFYPAACLETGYDILFFWVARMVMLGLEFTDESPFHTIYMHGLVRDGEGRKMSKTTGNVIDPLDTIDKYGTDALRFTLVTGCTPGQDIPLSMEKVEGNLNFVNKLWNVGKYLQNMMQQSGDDSSLAVTEVISQEELETMPMVEKYIISSCHELVTKVTASLEAYDFGDAGRRIYKFLWDEFADWYIEISKTRMTDKHSDKAKLARKVLVYVWDRSLRLLHPFMPYLTEVLWQLIPHSGRSIMISEWPQLNTQQLSRDIKAESTFNSLQSMIRAIRNARSEYDVEPGKKISARIVASSDTLLAELEQERAALALLGRIDANSLDISANDGTYHGDNVKNSVHLIVEDGLEVFLPMDDLVDKDKEIQRLNKQAEKLMKDIEVLQKRLETKGFIDKAPAEKIEKVRVDLSEKLEQMNTIKESLVKFEKA